MRNLSRRNVWASSMKFCCSGFLLCHSIDGWLWQRKCMSHKRKVKKYKITQSQKVVAAVMDILCSRSRQEIVQTFNFRLEIACQGQKLTVKKPWLVSSGGFKCNLFDLYIALHTQSSFNFIFLQIQNMFTTIMSGLRFKGPTRQKSPASILALGWLTPWCGRLQPSR